MAEKQYSPIFGETMEPDVTQKIMIETLVQLCPVAVFQALNKKLNVNGYLISIDVNEWKKT
jgi:hypothetical protein